MATTERIWPAGTLIDPHAQPDKPQRVEATFERIARRYDLNNRLHSLWRDQAWRRRAVRLSAVGPAQAVLDLATGTGDLAGWFARLTPAGQIVGLDFCQAMLDVAHRKFSDPRLEWLHAGAAELPFDDASFDVAAMAFGLRNVASPQVVLAQMHRVLKAGGRAVLLEFASPTTWPSRLLWRCVNSVMPVTAGLIAGDTGAYRYLGASIRTFCDAAGLDELMRRAGFTGIRRQEMALGLVAVHVGTKP
jgi:demethylmenaquinone methyltransferase / 2-methoxy-6-polyprenyl-1,4-benzoquinol methylase